MVDELTPGEPAAPDDPLLASLFRPHPSAAVVTPSLRTGHDTVAVDRAELVEFVTTAHEAGFTTFVDLCAVDYLSRDPRYDVVIVLLATTLRRRLVVRVGVPGEAPVVPSITSVFPGANFYEREAWDLLGVEFAGHPDLTRILLPDEWVGHPLRKDEGVGSVPVQFKESHKAT